MASVGLERVSTILGYQILKGNFNETSPNLPQSIAVLGEANNANQSGLETDGTQITSAQQAGTLYGFGSPLYHVARILFPVNGGGQIGGIPVKFYAQAAGGGATSKVVEIAVTGTATGNTTHTVIIGGRTGLDGTRYDINIETGDTVAEISAKIEDAINNVLGSPVSASSTDYEATLETKWKGLTANELTVSVETNDNAVGLTYAVSSVQSGSATPSIAAALAQFGNEWHTIVVNTYGTQSGIMDALEAFNGIPSATPTGRYAGTVFKPFIALTGSVAENPSSITDTRLDDVTIAICPAPLSQGFHFEAAANMCSLFARISQDTPNLDVQDLFYADMPTPASIGVMSSDTDRDVIVKKGCSTVDLVNAKYRVKDFVTTYHPLGEIPPQFRYCRNLMLDFNIKFAVYLIIETNILGHSISADADTVTATKTFKPKQGIQLLRSFADSLGLRALIADVDFMKASITCDISSTNPDRIELFFRYKRTGFGRIVATTAEAGFNFGNA